LKPAEYNELTIGEFVDCVQGYQDRTEDIAVLTDSLNHILGSYVGVAVNAPKKYPKKPVATRKKKSGLKKVYSEAETEQWLKDKGLNV